MENIPLPSKITIKEGKNNFHSIVIIEPCFPGHGLTLGNALRRNLLSALTGAAVIAFKIKGVQHEFSAGEGVKEDVVDISLNLKQLRLKVFTDSPVRLELKVRGEKRVTAKDISPNSDVEIINKDLLLFTLTNRNTPIEMEIVVSRGRGYVTAESRESEELETGMISIDSSFTPIKRIGFNVENVRVGQMTNWDKLILDIETDGTITPPEALKLSVQDLVEHFNFIMNNLSVEKQMKAATEIKQDELPIITPEVAEPAETKDEVKAEKPKKAKRGRKKAE